MRLKYESKPARRIGHEVSQAPWLGFPGCRGGDRTDHVPVPGDMRCPYLSDPHQDRRAIPFREREGATEAAGDVSSAPGLRAPRRHGASLGNSLFVSGAGVVSVADGDSKQHAHHGGIPQALRAGGNLQLAHRHRQLTSLAPPTFEVRGASC